MKFILTFIFLAFCVLRTNAQLDDNYLDSGLFSVGDCDTLSMFKALGEVVKDKRIVMLGENGHGDGSSFEIRSDLIEFLVKEHGFTTVILEGGSFFEYQYLNGNLPSDSTMNSAYYGWSYFWADAQETQSLVQLMDNDGVHVFGMDCNGSYGSFQFNGYLKNNYEFNDIDWAKLNRLCKRLLQQDITLTSHEVKEIENIYWDIKRQIDFSKIPMNEKDVLLQSLANILVQCRSFRNFVIDKDPRYLGINFRDAQMADNVIWYMDRNPKAKVIVWAANFHISTDISQVTFNEEDSTVYDNYHVLGMHLKHKYWDDVYSIGFTSGGGSTGVFLSEESVPIENEEYSYEYKLYQKPICFGFIDFSQINRNLLTPFYSTMLGYRVKTGSWAKAFDGLFYIRTQHPSTPME